MFKIVMPQPMNVQDWLYRPLSGKFRSSTVLLLLLITLSLLPLLQGCAMSPELRAVQCPPPPKMPAELKDVPSREGWQKSSDELLQSLKLLNQSLEISLPVTLGSPGTGPQ